MWGVVGFGLRGGVVKAQVLAIDVLEETRRRGKINGSVDEPRAGKGHHATLHGTRDRDVEQTPFLLNLRRRLAEFGGKKVLFEPDDIHRIKLQSFGGVYGHKCDTRGVVLQVLVLVRQQTYFREEILYRREGNSLVHALYDKLMNTGEQFVEVLLAVNAFGGTVHGCRRHDTGLTHDPLGKRIGIFGINALDKTVHQLGKGSQLGCGSGT